MSIILDASHVQSLTERERQTWEKQLTVVEDRVFNKIKPDYSPRKQICTLHRHENLFFLPFARAIDMGFRCYRSAPAFAEGWRPFLVELREEQKKILADALIKLKSHGTLLLAVYPGGGKTITTLRLCRALGYPVLIIVNRLVLMDQWKKSIIRCFGGGGDSSDNDSSEIVQCISAKKDLHPGRHFYIINAINVPKFDERDWREHLGIGTLVVDECHLIMTKVFVQSLGCVAPRFLVGLSATPYRNDGMNDLFEIYFGSSKTCIYVPLYRHHYVYPLRTSFTYENEYSAQGRLLWNRIIDRQSFLPERQILIAKLCQEFGDRRILILGKRVEALRQLSCMIPGSAIFVGTQVGFDESARVLVSTFSKVGTGFSHDCLDMLILANDTEDYFLQYLGRVFRRPDVVPIVIDIVDNHAVLQNHFRTRSKVYKETGGVICKPPSHWTITKVPSHSGASHEDSLTRSDSGSLDTDR